MCKELNKPCNECPFRRKAAPGYLGALSYQPSAFLEPFQWQGVHAPCHMTIDYEGDWETQIEVSPTCHGYAVYMKNQDQMPHNEQDAAKFNAVDEDHENIFSNMREFIEHHSRNPK